MAGMFVPQMVTPVDTSFLRDIGNTIGGLREDSDIASIMKGIDPYDPNSLARVTSDLYAYGSRPARDMADRLLGVAQKREDTVYGRKQTEQARQDELERQRRWDVGARGGPSLADLQAPQTPAAAAPAAPKLPPSEFWDEAPAPAPGPQRATAAPAPLFAAQPQRGQSLAQIPPSQVVPQGTGSRPEITGPAEASIEGRPLGIPSAVPGAPSGGGRPSPLPPASLGPMAGVPQRAPVEAPQVPQPQMVAPGGRAVVTAPPRSVTPIQPPVQAPAAARTPVTAEEQFVQRGMDYWANQLQGATTPGEKALATAKYNEFKQKQTDIDTAKKEAAKPGQQAAEEAGKLGAKTREELVKTAVGYRQVVQDTTPSLNQMEAIVSKPGYLGGPRADDIKDRLGLMNQMNSMAIRFLGVGLPEGWVKRTFQDPASELHTVVALSNEITRKKLGTLGSGTSTPDLIHTQREGVTDKMDAETAKRIILINKTTNARLLKIHELIMDGVQRDKTNAEIEQRLRKYGEDNPMFVNKDGTLTEIGRRTTGTPVSTAASERPKGGSTSFKSSDEGRPVWDDSGREGRVVGGKFVPLGSAAPGGI